MSILSRLRNIWYRARVETMIRQADREIEPLFDLSAAVGKAAFGCAEALKTEINPEQAPDAWVYVCFEFVYFFMHLVSRSALTNLGNERSSVLLDKLAPFVAKGIVVGLFDHWPEERKRGIERDFFEKLNATELEYGKCRGLFSKENPLTGDSLLSTLARNVAELMGKPLNPVTMVEVVQAAAAQIQTLNLDALVKAAGEGLSTGA